MRRPRDSRDERTRPQYELSILCGVLRADVAARSVRCVQAPASCPFRPTLAAAPIAGARRPAAHSAADARGVPRAQPCLAARHPAHLQHERARQDGRPHHWARRRHRQLDHRGDRRREHRHRQGGTWDGEHARVSA
eukprot:3209583-Pleurochrysis_carterae.AAC.2